MFFYPESSTLSSWFMACKIVFFGLLFMIVSRIGIFFHKTGFREKLKDSQRVKIYPCFAFSFFKSQMKLFSKQESVVFLNPILTFDLFFWKKKDFTWNENFPTCKTSVFQVLESQGLDYEELRKIEPSDHWKREIGKL